MNWGDASHKVYRSASGEVALKACDIICDVHTLQFVKDTPVLCIPLKCSHALVPVL